MLQDTRQDTAAPGPEPAAGADPWAPFRLQQPRECLALLRSLCEGRVPLVLNAPDGSALHSAVWAVDAAAQRLSLGAQAGLPSLQRLVEANEAVAVAYLENVKLQFDLHGLVLVHGATGCALHSRLPQAIYRFQRRNAFRVRSAARCDPVARFRHPALPEMSLSLRLLDLSLGGCALWLPADVPPLQAGTRLGPVQVELDADTRFESAAVLQHISSLDGAGGVRVGCEWQSPGGSTERLLQRWIARTQQRQRLLGRA